MSAANPQPTPAEGPPASGPPPAAPPATPPPAATGGQESEAALKAARDETTAAIARAEAAEKKLQEADEATKTEAEKLAARAAKADSLEPQVKALTAALTEEVERQKALLPEAMRDLMPALTPDQQLNWIAKAREAAGKIVPSQDLPPSGGRSPGTPPQGAQQQQAFDRALSTLPALAGRVFPDKNGGS